MEKITVYKNKSVIYQSIDTAIIFRRLAGDLIHKKINNGKYIRSIKRVNLYNGYIKITVYQPGDVKTEYIIKE